MERKEICDKVFAILKQILDEGETLSEKFDEDISGAMDSIKFVTLIVQIEKEFNIEIDDDDFEISKMDTINKISDLISTYIN